MYDVEGGFGWYCDKSQLQNKEKIQLERELEEEQKKLNILEMNLQMGLIVVLFLRSFNV